MRDHPCQRLIIKCLTIIQIELEFGNVGLLMSGENRRIRKKTSRSNGENQQQTQPTYDAGSGNRTRDTMVGGECSHHCAIPVPSLIRLKLKYIQETVLRRELYLKEQCYEEFAVLGQFCAKIITLKL